MSNVQLPGSSIFDSQMKMHTRNQNNDISLAKEFQQHLTKEHRKKMVSFIRANTKIFMETKWTDRQYHVQDNFGVAHKYVKMYCNSNQLPELSFCGPYSKPHGARGLSNHYHLRFDPKLGNSVCVIFHILCAYVAWTSMLDKPWISGIPSNKQ